MPSKKHPEATKRAPKHKPKRRAINYYSEATRRKVVALYSHPKKPISIEQISRKTGVSPKTVHKWLRAAKVKIRKGPRYPKEKIMVALRSKKKRAWICTTFGCSPKYVSQLAKEIKAETGEEAA